MTTANLHRDDIDRTAAGAVLRTMAGWVPPDRAGEPLHPGDVCWALRFEDDSPARERLLAWSDPDGLAAVGLLDGRVLRTAVAPRARTDAALATQLADDIGALLPTDEAWVDTADDGALRAELTRRGWGEADEPWVRFARPLAPAPAWPAGAELVPVTGAVGDRVAVQRSSFTGSTFTPARWATMTGPPAGEYCVDVLVRDGAGRAVAAATGWFAGPGRCGLLEPVGTHAEHRGHGYGRTAVAAACAGLADLGASAVAVATPQSNEAATALYRSAGFDAVAVTRDLHRAA